MSLRARRTRDRILEASLRLFNEQGAPHVTTNDIAQELGISPGNLHYHFRHKGDIVAELFARFRARADAILAVPAGRGANVEDVRSSVARLSQDEPARYRGRFSCPI